jgi:carboxylesterase type B
LFEKIDDSDGPEKPRTFTWTKTKQADLEIVVHFPPGWKETDKRPGIVFFFGGGWENGSASNASYAAATALIRRRVILRTVDPSADRNA